MKKLDTSHITISVGQPIKQGTLDFLQQAHQETTLHAIRQILGETYGSSFVYVLWGCQNTGSGANYVIGEGAVFYNGEIYYVPAATFSLSGGQVAIATVTSSPTLAANADPVEFTDLSSFNVHFDRTIVVSAGSTGGFTDYSSWIDSRSKLSKIEVSPYGGTAPAYASTNFANDGAGVYQKLIIQYHPREKKVTLTGVVKVTTLATGNNVVLNLPSKYRPVDRLLAPAIIETGSTDAILMIKVYDGGDLVISNNTGGSFSNVYVGINIVYFTA